MNMLTPVFYYPSLIIRSKDGCDYGAPADIYVIANECLAPTIDPVNPVCQGENDYPW